MEENSTPHGVSFGARIGMALRLLFSGDFARQVVTALRAPVKSGARPASTPAPTPGPAAPVAAPPERPHASGLILLSALQREGRLVDFLQQDVAGFSDEEVGAAARVVHEGCRKVLQQYFTLVPASPDTEGATVSVPKGFDAQRTRLTGNVAGEPPFRGTLKHHGWVAQQVRLPSLSEAMDPKVIAPAEVEL